MAKRQAVTEQKDPAAVALGRKGGLKRVPKGFAMMTSAERAALSAAGVKARQKRARQRKRAAAGQA